ncbi:MAG TPA: hypothetical protein VK469_19480 [Candidatus Kapabacteria bacterium]|nr:hypothetical protein [Candidatus Kapabacteria bacterium]
MDKKDANVQNTVYVIGAGASKEANLPTGYELKGKIIQALDIRHDFQQQFSGDYIITEALRISVKRTDNRNSSINQYITNAAWLIRDALPLAISIDNFIDAHRDDDKIALCGKLAIVQSILEAEKNSPLYFESSNKDSKIPFLNLEKTWYNRFFQLLTESCEKNDLQERFESVTLIIFNYDRCIEHFIYYALQNYYRVTGHEAAELVKAINIYHPYGDVGSLPWQNREPVSDKKLVMEFGKEPEPEQLLELSNNIKTFTEGTDPQSSEISEIRRHLKLADRVVFLGFAFHPMNMQIITPENTYNNPVKVFATTLGISDSDKEVISAQIKKSLPGRNSVSMMNKTCYEFFGEYWRSLSFC